MVVKGGLVWVGWLVGWGGWAERRGKGMGEGDHTPVDGTVAAEAEC